MVDIETIAARRLIRRKAHDLVSMVPASGSLQGGSKTAILSIPIDSPQAIGQRASLSSWLTDWPPVGRLRYG
jgi:hypothetical protein